MRNTKYMTTKLKTIPESIREASAAEHPVETVAVVIDSYQFADFAPAHHFVVQHCLQVKVLLH